MIKIHGYEKLQELAKDFWNSDDQFIINSGYTIGTFHSQINKLQANNNNPDSKLTKAQLATKRSIEEWNQKH